MINLLKILCFLFLLHSTAWAQTCDAPGQNPSTAFPVCGTSKFYQSIVPNCGGKAIPGPCSNDGITDMNPFWYKFTCFQSGTLGFLIEPDDQLDDYDWQLFDVTGHDPNDVYTDESLFVACNWSGNTGNTGASTSGTSLKNCAGPAFPTFSAMPALIKGHNYLLLLSHFTTFRPGDKGYHLSFGGGNAVITDTTPPHIKMLEASCSGDQLGLKLNKNMLCSSIATDGSDFTINAPGISIIGSTGVNCSQKFDTDSLLLQLSAPLPAGNYTIGVKNGSDGNTLLDYCDNQVPTSDVLSIVIVPKQPTPMDSMAPLTCAPQQLHLLFKKPIVCSSVAADGSDFVVSGKYPVQVISAAGTCTDDLTKEIVLTLDKPLQQAGNFRLVLQRGSDGNTITDECTLETPAGSSLDFSVKDTVNADFSYAVKYGCSRDTISLFHKGAGVTSWTWDMDDRQHSTAQNPQGIYTVFSQKNISLVVSNGFCSDTTSQTVLLDNYLKADFNVFADICPKEPVQFTGTAQGKVTNHYWEFGDGGTATVQTPSYTFQTPDRQQTFNIRYTVTDSFGCQSTAIKPITVYTSCYLAVPTAFTPNNDGLNDFLAPLNAIKAMNLQFRVYNRWGQLVFSTTDWKHGWDGTFRGQPQPTATYVWMLQYTNRDTGKQQQIKGTAVLIR